jgi:uncharacterized protein YciI
MLDAIPRTSMMRPRTEVFMRHIATIMLIITALCASGPAARADAPPSFDAALAQRLGADDRGMRDYVLVILKTGPTPMPKGEKRSEMFKGHFANIQRLSDEGKLAAAGPFDGTDGWRGLFIFAVKDIEEAKALTATDPVIQSGEMVAEYHKLYSSAALMLVGETHRKIQKPGP